MPITVTTERRSYPDGAGLSAVTVPAPSITATALAPAVRAGFSATSTIASSTVTALPPGIVTGSYAQQEVGWIGDQLTYQDGTGPANIKSALVANGWPITSRVDGLIGRAIIGGTAPYVPSSQDVISSWRAEGFNPRTWVLALITTDEWDTDAGWTTKVNTLLDLINSVLHYSESRYRIFWIGGPAYRPDIQANSPYSTRASRFKAVMASIAASRVPEFESITHIDVTSMLHNGRDESGLWSESDSTGRNMTATGYALRNSITVPLVTTPTAASAGFGLSGFGTGPFGG